MLRFSSLVLLLASIYAADALPGGAPRGACDNLSPSHGTNTPQISEVPYNIDLAQFDDGTGTLQYVPGQTYTLTLQGETFLGFFVQCRLMADDTTRVGVFAVDAANTRLSSCPVDTDGITHSSEIPRTSVTMDWTAPDVGTGPVRFGFAVAQAFEIFWANERSATLQEATMPPSLPPSLPPSSPPSSSPPSLPSSLPPSFPPAGDDDVMSGDGDDDGSATVLVISTLTLLLSTVGAVLL